MNVSRSISLSLALYLACCASSAVAQSNLKPPPDPIKMLVSTENKDHKVVLSDRGHALEVPLALPIVGRESFAIEAVLGEPGRFELELASAKDPVKVQNVVREGGTGRAEVVRSFKLIDREEYGRQVGELLKKGAGGAAVERGEKSAQEAKPDELKRYLKAIGMEKPPDDESKQRELYALGKAYDKRADLLREKLAESAKEHPRWFPPEDKKAWETMEWTALFLYYCEVAEAEVADELLTASGLDFDRSTRNAVKGIKPMLLALNDVASGRYADNPEVAKRVHTSISGPQMTILREFLTVDLKLRIYSDSGNTDPNSLWFNAQRIACRATGVGSIRVEGSLDPAKGDSADWWIIDRWEPGSIQFTTSTEGGVQFDPPKVEEGVARLRVAAGEKAARYWFEMRAERGGELKVVVHESHIPAESKFPY